MFNTIYESSILSILNMSQSDNSLFFILVRSLFFITAFGFGTCLVHLFYQSVSEMKLRYNYLTKVTRICKILSAILKK